MSDSIKSFLKTAAIFIAGLFGIISSATALNHAYDIHNGFLMFCAGFTLVVVLLGLGVVFKKQVMDKFVK